MAGKPLSSTQCCIRGLLQLQQGGHGCRRHVLGLDTHQGLRSAHLMRLPIRHPWVHSQALLYLFQDHPVGVCAARKGRREASGGEKDDRIKGRR